MNLKNNEVHISKMILLFSFLKANELHVDKYLYVTIWRNNFFNLKSRSMFNRSCEDGVRLDFADQMIYLYEI